MCQGWGSFSKILGKRPPPYVASLICKYIYDPRTYKYQILAPDLRQSLGLPNSCTGADPITPIWGLAPRPGPWRQNNTLWAFWALRPGIIFLVQALSSNLFNEIPENFISGANPIGGMGVSNCFKKWKKWEIWKLDKTIYFVTVYGIWGKWGHWSDCS